MSLDDSVSINKDGSLLILTDLTMTVKNMIKNNEITLNIDPFNNLICTNDLIYQNNIEISNKNEKTTLRGETNYYLNIYIL